LDTAVCVVDAVARASHRPDLHHRLPQALDSYQGAEARASTEGLQQEKEQGQTPSLRTRSTQKVRGEGDQDLQSRTGYGFAVSLAAVLEAA
jgi:hypothetical protein